MDGILETSFHVWLDDLENEASKVEDEVKSFSTNVNKA
jgi:hypothetical protein